MHNKFVVVDRKNVLIGSMNLTNSSLNFNWECASYFRNYPELASDYMKIHRELRSDCKFSHVFDSPKPELPSWQDFDGQSESIAVPEHSDEFMAEPEYSPPKP